MRYYYLVFVLFCLSYFPLYGESYYELSEGQMPFRPSKKCFSFAYGQRHMEGNTGVDFSVSQKFSSGMHNSTTARGLIVYQNKNGFYAGVGPGVTNFMNTPPRGGGKWQNLQAVTMEGVVGYDLPHIGRIKPSLQLNVSQPLHVMHSSFREPIKKHPSIQAGLKFKF